MEHECLPQAVAHTVQVLKPVAQLVDGFRGHARHSRRHGRHVVAQEVSRLIVIPAFPYVSADAIQISEFLPVLLACLLPRSLDCLRRSTNA